MSEEFVRYLEVPQTYRLTLRYSPPDEQDATHALALDLDEHLVFVQADSVKGVAEWGIYRVQREFPAELREPVIREIRAWVTARTRSDEDAAGDQSEYVQKEEN